MNKTSGQHSHKIQCQCGNYQCNNFVVARCKFAALMCSLIAFEAVHTKVHIYVMGRQFCIQIEQKLSAATISIRLNEIGLIYFTKLTSM